jgi:hypothetical protein
MKIATFRDVTPCSLVDNLQHFESCVYSIIKIVPEDGGSVFVKNIDDCTLLHSGTPHYILCVYHQFF